MAADARGIRLNQKAFSLIEVMIVVGLMSIVGLGIASMMSDMSTSQASLEEKLATIDAGNSLARAFALPAVCGYQLNQAESPINLSVPNPTVSYKEVRLGLSNTSTLIVEKGKPLAGFPANKMKVQSITLKNIALIAGTNFSGDLEVVLDATTTRKVLKPFGVKNIIFTATPSLNGITSCSAGAGVHASLQIQSNFVSGIASLICPAGFLLSNCHAEVNSIDGQSMLYQQKLVFTSTAGQLTGCSSTMTDSDDFYRLVAICIQ